MLWLADTLRKMSTPLLYYFYDSCKGDQVVFMISCFLKCKKCTLFYNKRGEYFHLVFTPAEKGTKIKMTELLPLKVYPFTLKETVYSFIGQRSG